MQTLLLLLLLRKNSYQIIKTMEKKAMNIIVHKYFHDDNQTLMAAVFNSNILYAFDRNSNRE